jgi:undecaprenyl pyrophosphate phosphatase UppP
MTLLQAIILGIVEGITEFLPISSTGHLILASRLLGLSQTDFQKSFEIAIQLGAIAAVMVLYWRRFSEPAVVSRVVVAFIPTGLIGFALYKIVKNYLFDSDVVVLWALGLGGVALIVFELAVPTMLAATGYDLLKHASAFEPQQFGVLAAGFIASFIVALLSVKFLLAFVRTRTFIPFGIYRIVVALAFAFI